MLLYDPLKFDIEEDEQIIIKSGKDGWFDDNKIEEVLKIANGRKIIYMSDIRISDDDFYKRELYIYEDLLKQQRWAINMGADFILLKFRLFFYQKDISEIDFINNDYVYTDNLIKDKIIFKKDDNLHNKNSYNMLYLSGKIYTQILQGARSTETRLFVKKIKYHKNIDNIVKYVNLPKESVENKYLFKYYSNDKYEGVLNNFNIYTRQKSFSSDINISKYIIGLEDDYTSKSIYYITKKWMKKNNKKINIDTIIELIIKTLTFFYKRYNNNLVICINKKLTANYYKNTNKPRDVDFDKSIYDDRKKIFFENLNKKMEYWNKQIKMLNTLNIDRFIINDYINSHKTQGQNYYDIKNNMFVRNYKNKK
jgi:archaellin